MKVISASGRSNAELSDANPDFNLPYQKINKKNTKNTSFFALRAKNTTFDHQFTEINGKLKCIWQTKIKSEYFLDWNNQVKFQFTFFQMYLIFILCTTGFNLPWNFSLPLISIYAGISVYYWFQFIHFQLSWDFWREKLKCVLLNCYWWE